MASGGKFVGKSLSFSGKPLVTNCGERVVLLRAALRSSRRKDSRILTVEEGALGSRLEAPRWVLTKAEGRSRTPENTAERAVTTVHATSSIGAKGSDGRDLWRDCQATVESVTVAGLVDGSTSRKIVLERETVEKESLDITGNGEAGR